MEDIITFLNTYRIIVGAVVITMLATVIIVRWWDKVKLFGKSFWYSLPGLGKVSSLAKDTARDKSGWFRSEKILCDDFYSDISNIAADPDMFDNAHSYLGKVQERGRNELGIFMWTVIIGLVFVEALGFGYILSGYTLPGASENMQVQGALGIAFLISAVLVYLTHASGAELHKRSLVKIARTWWVHDAGESRPNLGGGNNRVSLQNDHLDDDVTNYQQMTNRLHTNANVTPGFPIWTAAAVVVIAFVAIAATKVRYDTYIQDRTAEATLSESSTTGFSLESLSGGMPSVLTAPQEQADQAAASESQVAQDSANLTTFAILALLFILIQAMGVGIGFKTGFAGKESKQARRIIGGFNSRSEYESWYGRKRDAIARIAQKHLSKLQGKLTEHAQSMGIDKNDRELLHSAADRTFFSHYEQVSQMEEENRRRDAGRREETSLHREDMKTQRETRAAQSQSAPVTQPAGDDMEARVRAELEAEKKAKEKADMEARIRAELEADAAAKAEQEQAPETEEEMRERLKREMGMA